MDRGSRRVTRARGRLLPLLGESWRGCWLGVDWGVRKATEDDYRLAMRDATMRRATNKARAPPMKRGGFDAMNPVVSPLFFRGRLRKKAGESSVSLFCTVAMRQPLHMSRVGGEEFKTDWRLGQGMARVAIGAIDGMRRRGAAGRFSLDSDPPRRSPWLTPDRRVSEISGIGLAAQG